MRASSCSSGGSASACSSCFSSGCVSSLVATGISSDSAISRRLRSIRRPAMYSSLRSAISLPLALAELPLPVGDASRRLIEAREGGVRERIVGRQLAEPLPGLDRLVVAAELAERHPEAVPRVGELRIDRQRLAVDRDRLLGLPVAEEIGRPVVELVLG